ncbi:MAG: hypothetical protein ED859_03765 [Desulfuromonadales bacterium]|nr:MAG: hypothetical protein ED859_03765 [Desulfuromonadales bacterium]
MPVVPAAKVTSYEVIMYPDGRMDSKNTATYIGKSEKTLAMMRCNGTGPKFIKRGRIFYFKDDVDVWLKEGTVTSTAQGRVLELRKGGVSKDNDGPKRRNPLAGRASQERTVRKYLCKLPNHRCFFCKRVVHVRHLDRIELQEVKP